jgi:PAS domain-containing protein
MTEPGPKQRHIALILARDFAATLSIPMFVVDADGDLVYFNEPAEQILGQGFSEAQMSAGEWATAFRPVDDEGRPVPLEELPLGIAFLSGAPAHRPLRIQGGDGVDRDIEVTAFPLFAHPDRLVGGVAVFWERSRER